MTLLKTKLFPMFALFLIVCAFLLATAIPAYASADPPAEFETLSVDEVWLTGDTLHIAVTDKNNGESQTLELNLKDYAKSGDEYVTVRATDADGNISNAIQFKNPYYEETLPSTDKPLSVPSAGKTESAVPSIAQPAGNGRPFTPDGTGSLIDNAESGDGKEFFTVETPDGNTFYLIVDRQRTADNVYLLNAVTESDLASLAKPNNGKSGSVIPVPTPSNTTAQEPAPAPTPAPPVEKNGMDAGAIAVIVIVVIAAGGIGYYFKIVRPKKTATDDNEDYGDEPDEDESDEDEDEEMEYGNDEESEVTGE